MFSPFPDDGLKVRQLLAAPHIHAQSNILLFALSVHDQLREFFNQKDRQVIGTVKAHVLQCF